MSGKSIFSVMPSPSFSLNLVRFARDSAMISKVRFLLVDALPGTLKRMSISSIEIPLVSGTKRKVKTSPAMTAVPNRMKTE